MGALANMKLTLAAAVANNGTIASIAYPAGSSEASLTGSKGGQIVRNGDFVYLQDNDDFEIAFSTTMTITNKSGVSWAVGDELIVSFGQTNNDGNYGLTRVAQPSIDPTLTPVTAPSGGSTTDTEARTAIGSLITELASVATVLGDIVAALEAAGITQPH